MRRIFAGVLAILASACAPGPARVPAAQASEFLELFAAGAGGSTDVCTPEGRAMLRGAVRAYGAEMAANGVAWPSLTARDQFSKVDASVLIAFAAGFIEASDLHGQARRMARELSFAHWPEIRGMRQAARVACNEVLALQQAAARAVMETERLRQMSEGAPPHGSDADERLRRQHERTERAHMQMRQLAAELHARLEATGSL
jgi:hypothetical protein